MIRDEDAFVKALSVYFIRLCGPDGGIFAYFFGMRLSVLFHSCGPAKGFENCTAQKEGSLLGCMDVRAREYSEAGDQTNMTWDWGSSGPPSPPWDEDAFVKALSVYFIRLCGPDGGIFAYFFGMRLSVLFHSCGPAKGFEICTAQKEGSLLGCMERKRGAFTKSRGTLHLAQTNLELPQNPEGHR